MLVRNIQEFIHNLELRTELLSSFDLEAIFKENNRLNLMRSKAISNRLMLLYFCHNLRQ
ncbi:hypothetical protein BN59_02233 [Legionella massiliensis]|uniref:Uncharacterized protein n=1 Tax=Legionella massiliensis TaxID=1034943 RepID=A0A078L1Q7_9GAMM|nr:hypothetical protein BN59_02233 [Legionella massiliensis]CEE13677.1 hypothetical protein BN1094_02233 [Legionella massiliensis]